MSDESDKDISSLKKLVENTEVAALNARQPTTSTGTAVEKQDNIIVVGDDNIGVLLELPRLENILGNCVEICGTLVEFINESKESGRPASRHNRKVSRALRSAMTMEMCLSQVQQLVKGEIPEPENEPVLSDHDARLYLRFKQINELVDNPDVERIEIKNAALAGMEAVRNSSE